MNRSSGVWVALAVVALAMVGCIRGRDQDVLTAPPTSPVEAEIWWDGVVERSTPDFLAVLCAASEIHRRNGTTATRVYSYTGVTMSCKYHFTDKMPLPLPDPVLAKAKIKLAGWTPGGDPHAYRNTREWIHWEAGTGCTAEQAARIWQEAETACGFAPQAGATQADATHP